MTTGGMMLFGGIRATDMIGNDGGAAIRRGKARNNDRKS
jgi:hypothetical protein